MQSLLCCRGFGCHVLISFYNKHTHTSSLLLSSYSSFVSEQICLYTNKVGWQKLFSALIRVCLRHSFCRLQSHNQKMGCLWIRISKVFLYRRPDVTFPSRDIQRDTLDNNTKEQQIEDRCLSLSLFLCLLAGFIFFYNIQAFYPVIHNRELISFYSINITFRINGPVNHVMCRTFFIVYYVIKTLSQGVLEVQLDKLK